jgi:hypothetical protein
MILKKAPVVNTGTRRYRTELRALYARRSAINALIESLVEYDRYRLRRLDASKRKTA